MLTLRDRSSARPLVGLFPSRGDHVARQRVTLRPLADDVLDFKGGALVLLVAFVAGVVVSVVGMVFGI